MAAEGLDELMDLQQTRATDVFYRLKRLGSLLSRLANLVTLERDPEISFRS